LGKRVGRGLFLAMLALTAACHAQAPGGQVLAVVNGEEITIPELNAEAHARGLAIGNDAGARQALLQELIDRRLLAQAARKEGLDRTPDYILQSRRANELVLVQQLNEVVSHSTGQPSPQQLSAFIAANPQAFGDRAVVTVEQMGLPGPVPAAKAAAVAAASSLEQAAAILGNPELANSKAMQTWDTARLDPQSASELLSAADGRLLVLHPPGSGWLVARKVSTAPSPVPPAQQQATAIALIKAQAVEQADAALLNRERAHSRVAFAKDGDEQPR
jgi:peptidyl-prolyl cis-trans isomerase C